MSARVPPALLASLVVIAIGGACLAAAASADCLQSVGNGITAADQAADVALAGTHAYVADGIAGLSVMDISNPADPRLVGEADTNWGASAVAVSGNYAYLADQFAGLAVVDISDPESPQTVRILDTPTIAADIALSTVRRSDSRTGSVVAR